MDLNAILISMISMGGLGILFSAGLSVANKIFYVEEDPRIGQVLEELPGANCGGCGLPGCAAFSEAVINGNIEVNGCPVNSQDGADAIALIMGVQIAAGERSIARVLCQGGIDETARKSDYHGIKTCIAAKISGSEKLCTYGCFGHGDCVRSCPFDAMYMNENGLPVVIDDKCTGCGNCVEACPQDIMELHPESDQLYVLCVNHDTPKDARKMCIKACVGCSLCVKAVDEDKMYMDNNLAVVDYSIFGKEAKLPTEKCPTKCLALIGEEK